MEPMLCLQPFFHHSQTLPKPGRQHDWLTNMLRAIVLCGTKGLMNFASKGLPIENIKGSWQQWQMTLLCRPEAQRAC